MRLYYVISFPQLRRLLVKKISKLTRGLNVVNMNLFSRTLHYVFSFITCNMLYYIIVIHNFSYKRYNIVYFWPWASNVCLNLLYFTISILLLIQQYSSRILTSIIVDIAILSYFSTDVTSQKRLKYFCIVKCGYQLNLLFEWVSATSLYNRHLVLTVFEKREGGVTRSNPD